MDYACSLKLKSTSKLWLGKDYTNFIVKDFNDLEKPYQDLVDRTTTPRMPWHDIGVLVQNAAARDVARHFIQRWNAVKVHITYSITCIFKFRYTSKMMNINKVFVIARKSKSEFMLSLFITEIVQRLQELCSVYQRGKQAQCQVSSTTFSEFLVGWLSRFRDCGAEYTGSLHPGHQ